ncbi:MAG: transglutaminase family protein [Burkholderiales bacterium]
MKISVEHTTTYVYEEPVRYSTEYLRLTPSSNARQRVLEWALEAPADPVELIDGYGNITHLLTITQPVSEIVIRSRGVVETFTSREEPRDDSRLSPLVFLRPTALTRAEGALADFAQQFRRRVATVSGLRELSGAVHARLPFKPGLTEVHSSAVTAFDAGCGVCQDHAHVFVACCRHVGVPARYVSGYLYLPQSGDSPVASHAWAEAWIVDRWRSFDITNQQPAAERHIRLAIGADYLEAGPVRGIRLGGGSEQMIVGAIVGMDQ